MMVGVVYCFKLLFQNHRKNDFVKDTNKFLSNSVLGKSIQSKPNECDIHIVTNNKMINKHAFLHLQEINFVSDGLPLIEKDKKWDKII